MMPFPSFVRSKEPWVALPSPVRRWRRAVGHHARPLPSSHHTRGHHSRAHLAHHLRRRTMMAAMARYQDRKRDQHQRGDQPSTPPSIFALRRVFKVLDAPFEAPDRVVIWVGGWKRFFRHAVLTPWGKMMRTNRSPRKTCETG